MRPFPFAAISALFVHIGISQAQVPPPQTSGTNVGPLQNNSLEAGLKNLTTTNYGAPGAKLDWVQYLSEAVPWIIQSKERDYTQI